MGKRMLKNSDSPPWHSNCYNVLYHNYNHEGVDPEKPGGNKK